MNYSNKLTIRNLAMFISFKWLFDKQRQKDIELHARIFSVIVHINNLYNLVDIPESVRDDCTSKTDEEVSNPKYGYQILKFNKWIKKIEHNGSTNNG